MSGTIDPNLAGVLDQAAGLHVVRADGKRSNEMPVTFTARKEVRMLAFGDLQCSAEDKADWNLCNTADQSPGDVSLNGFHQCTDVVSAFLGCWDSGVDRFWTTLSNGWTIYNAQIVIARGNAQEVPAIGHAGPGPVDFSVWWDTRSTYSYYYVYVYVEGPAGTSYK